MEDFMDASVDLKPRVCGSTLGLEVCKYDKFLVVLYFNVYNPSSLLLSKLTRLPSARAV